MSSCAKHSAAAVSALLTMGATFNASAQSAVTLYGVADINIEFATHVGNVPSVANQFSSGTANNAYRMNSGGVAGSRWGIRGVEALSSGLNSIFVLESGFAIDSGVSEQSGRLFGRQAFVGLQDQRYGQVTFGRQYTSSFDALANFSPMAFATQYDPVVVLTGPDFREDNMLKYSGTFGPITAVAHWSFGSGVALPQVVAPGVALGGNGEVPGQFRRDTAYGGGLNYFAGPLGLALSYDQLNPSMGATGGVISSGTFKKVATAASYSFGAAKLMAGYRWGQNKAPNGDTLQRDDLYWIGGTYQVTPALSLSVSYNYQNMKSFLGSMSTPNPWQVGFLSSYSFSKRTEFYLTSAFSKHAGLMLDSPATVFANSLALGNSYALAGGKDNMFGVAVGIRHTF